jgi:hypothetical protein
MQPKFEGHKTVRIAAGQESFKVGIKDYGGNETTKDIRQLDGIAGRIRKQVVGASVEWQIPQWFYDIETDDGTTIRKIPERCLEAVI